jgi:hypothetical protein
LTEGPLFRVEGKTRGSFKKASTGDLDQSFLGILNRVQGRWPSVIPDTVNVEEEYTVSRSLRCRATSHAQNVKTPKEVIESNNRWRKRSRSNGLLDVNDGEILGRKGECNNFDPFFKRN